MKDAYAVYRNTNVETADSAKLILIVFDVAIKNCKLALEKFDNKELLEERKRHLLKIQDAITELMSSLNLDAGQVAKNLYSLYEYMMRRLAHANTRNEHQPIEEILGYLSELRSVWSDAMRSLKVTNGHQKETTVKNVAMVG